MDSASVYEKSCNSRVIWNVAQNAMINYKLASSFIRTLIYFDIFSYPLTREEILSYSACKNFTSEEGLKTLECLLELRVVNYSSGYYFIGDSYEKISKRVAGNKLAVKRLRKARQFSAIIASFPFTRGVFISGSLSKGYMDSDSDIDYFILTSPNRLWLSRTLLVLFKKLFLLNSHRNFCVNYFIDTDNLEVKERNIYTATEVALLLPMHNYRLFEQFMKSNGWVKEYFPNHVQVKGKPIKGIPVVKKIFEILLDNKLGDILDNFFFKTTTRYWQNKHGRYEIDRPDSDLLWNKHISQYNPRHFRHTVLSRFQNKISEFENQTGFTISEL